MTEKDDLALEALLELCDAIEAGIASVKACVGTVKRVTPMPDFDLLYWTKQQGTKGEYEQTCRENNKPEPFGRLQAELKEHKGFWRYKGFQYWFHQNDENVIDRRRVNAQTRKGT